MEIENTLDYYKTSDLYEAAFLCTCSGVQHVGQEKIVAKFFFLFKSKLQCEILSKLYWSREAYSNPLTFAESIRTLKDMIFSKGQNYA